MGRRSRKRGGESTRAERDAARRERDLQQREAAASGRPAPRPRPRPGRPSAEERPQPPWGSFPLSELVILIGIVLIAWGAVSGEGGEERLFAGLVIASLGGGELALREHLAGYRSHSTLLAGLPAVAVAGALFFASAPWVALVAVAAATFAAVFLLARTAFRRRSGGLSFR
jgi:hypothetical protein